MFYDRVDVIGLRIVEEEKVALIRWVVGIENMIKP